MKGLPILFIDLAGTWWQGVKFSVSTWIDAIELLRKTYGPKKPPHRVFRDLFSHEQDDQTATHVFVCQARAKIPQLPPDTLKEETEIDMVYITSHTKFTTL